MLCIKNMKCKKTKKSIHELRALLIIWDECLHVPLKNLNEVSKQFMNAFHNAFNHELKFELPIVHVSTPSIMFPKLNKFEHDGRFIDYKDNNKDLALIKYCSSGIADDKGHFYHAILDAYKSAIINGMKFPAHSLEKWGVIFITKDEAYGMDNAKKWLQETDKSQCLVATLHVPNEYAVTQHKNKFAGELLAVDLRKRFKDSTETGWLVDIAS